MTWRCMCGTNNYQQFLRCVLCNTQAPTAAATIAREAAANLKPAQQRLSDNAENLT